MAVLASLGLPGWSVGCGGATSGQEDGAGGTSAGSGGGTQSEGGNPTGGGGIGSEGGKPTGGAGAANLRDCVNPTPVHAAPVSSAGSSDAAPAPPADVATSTGFVACDGGWLHRPKAQTCPSYLPRAREFAPPTDGTTAACLRDSDCTAAPLGRCDLPPTTFGYGGAPPRTPGCGYGCMSDAECGSGRICLCGSPVGTCWSATCATDADCDGGALCAASPKQGVCGGAVTYDFACQDPSDQCLRSQECPVGMPGARCVVTSLGRRCESGSVCGRPFLVEGTARLASPCAGHGWSAELAPRTSGLGAADRARLCEHWTRVALMEHASVASFARFALELMSLGAPAELLRDTASALSDEIAHAELCFALAGTYAGAPLRPAPLALEGAIGPRPVVEVCKSAFLEACIGETLAVAQAGAALESATDPTVCRVLERIVKDEASHASLGFRFMRWVLESQPAYVRAAIETEMRIALEEELAKTNPDDEAMPAAQALVEHGLLGPALEWQARRAALLEVCVPCVDALLAPRLPRAA